MASLADSSPQDPASRSVSWTRSTATFLEMIKISHTVFALPFAIGASFLAAGGMPRGSTIGKIVLAVLFARTAAMAFNRLVDRKLDAENPRTAMRALPAGTLNVGFVRLATLTSCVAFVATCWWIGSLALKLSPIALAIALGYSLCKRFTILCHAVLGAALALAPMGAWVAVTNTLPWQAWLLGSAVLLWTTGFDILYSCMDSDFDREYGLFSIPTRLGVTRALRLSAVLHLAMVLALALLAHHAALGLWFWSAVGLVFAILVYEHALVRPDDLSRVNRAFFTMNGIISLLLMLAMMLSTTLD